MVDSKEAPTWRNETYTRPSRPAASSARGRVSLPGLRTRLIFYFLLLILAIAAVGAFISTRLVAASVRERFDNFLAEASRASGDGLARREREHLEHLRQMALTSGVWEAYGGRDSLALQNLLAPLALEADVQVVSAVGLDGLDILTLYRAAGSDELAASAGADYSGLGVVRDVLSGHVDELGDKYTEVAVFPSGAYLLSSAPVRNPDGQLVGVLLVGTRLNTLLAELKGQTLADVFVLDPNGKLVAATLPEPELGFTVLEVPASLVPQAGQSTVRTLDVNNRSFTALYSPLMLRGREMGVLGVALPDAYAVNRLAADRNPILLAFIIGTLLIMLLGYVLAMSIATPILRLRAVTTAAAAGDLNQSTRLRGRDELGDLGLAIDTLLQRLRARTEEVKELSQAVSEQNGSVGDYRRRLQAIQQQALQSERLAAAGAVAAGIANELKKPLASIVGTADQLGDRHTRQPELRQELKGIRETAVLASRLIDDLLKLTQHAPLEFARQDLRQTVARVLQMTKHLTREAGVMAHVEVPDHAVDVEHDGTQIEHVLIHLVRNAILAMPNGGTLKLQLKELRDGVSLTVHDTGIGIAPANLSRVFDPFFATQMEGEGMGLGLAVSRAIIMAHHGRLDVASRVGEGTVFSIWLPYAQPHDEVPAAAEPQMLAEA